MLQYCLSAVFLYGLMCHCFIAEGWLWIPRRFADRWFPWHFGRWEVTFLACSAPTHTWVHKPGPARVPDTMGEWGVSTKTAFVMRPELCSMLINCPPPWSFSVSSVYMNTHYFFPPTHTSSASSCLSELWHVLMLLAPFCWGLVTAVLSEKFFTKLGDHFC